MALNLLGELASRSVELGATALGSDSPETVVPYVTCGYVVRARRGTGIQWRDRAGFSPGFRRAVA
ncbi:hypothetical protein GCM10009654_04920 [Streptomyces hebeiensis]|uniref:Uncharacterized protein n=1 Tax=Streptomyces hebeiensis TaxID=229486 RepID=A0ABP4F7W2_9ACTN